MSARHPSDRIKVLYIAGSGRSASTFLGLVLGQLPAFCFVGEIIGSWRAFEHRLCGCGAPFVECAFWDRVGRAAGNDAAAIEPRELFAFARLARWRHMPWLLSDERRAAARFAPSWSGGARLYAALTAVSQARIIVDSSKSAVYGRMLSLLPTIDLHVVHLIRDPRAVAYSWMRRKNVPEPNWPEMNRRRPAHAAAFWAISNVGAELFCRRAPGRFMRLRYEDLTARPRESIQRILTFLGEDASVLPLAGERTVTLRPTHSVKGNPDRFRDGSIAITLDDEWRTAMRSRDRRTVTALTWPLMLRYGYAA